MRWGLAVRLVRSSSRPVMGRADESDPSQIDYGDQRASGRIGGLVTAPSFSSMQRFDLGLTAYANHAAVWLQRWRRHLVPHLVHPVCACPSRWLSEPAIMKMGPSPVSKASSGIKSARRIRSRSDKGGRSLVALAGSS